MKSEDKATAVESVKPQHCAKLLAKRVRSCVTSILSNDKSDRRERHICVLCSVPVKTTRGGMEDRNTAGEALLPPCLCFCTFALTLLTLTLAFFRVFTFAFATIWCTMFAF